MSLPDRFATSFRLTKAAQDLIEEVAAKLGVGKTAVVELAVRELAERKLIGSAK